MQYSHEQMYGHINVEKSLNGNNCIHSGALRFLAKHQLHIAMPYIHCLYMVFRAQADLALTHTSHAHTEQSTIEASITLDDVTLTDLLIR
jgi:hypothetical protein